MAIRLRLTQALGNVLGNAAKYTERGGQHRAAACARARRDVEIRVRDTGIGIPAEVLPKIFDLFTQLDQRIGATRRAVWASAWLWCGALVEMHGGSVTAHSEGPGEGANSSFVCR